MERFKVNINKSKLSIACLALALGLTGCNSNKVRNDLPDTTESTTTAATEITTEENNSVSEELNINDNISIEGKVKYLPIYMIMFIYRENIPNLKFSLDLSGLQ